MPGTVWREREDRRDDNDDDALVQSGSRLGLTSEEESTACVSSGSRLMSFRSPHVARWPGREMERCIKVRVVTHAQHQMVRLT